MYFYLFLISQRISGPDPKGYRGPFPIQRMYWIPEYNAYPKHYYSFNKGSRKKKFYFVVDSPLRPLAPLPLLAYWSKERLQITFFFLCVKPLTPPLS